MLTTLNRGILSMQSSVFSFNLTPPPSGFPSSSSYFFLLQSFHIQQHTTSSWLHKMTSFFHFIDRWFAAKELWMRVEDKIRWKRRTICYINDFISFHCCFPFVFILFFFLRFFFVFASSLVAFRLFFRSFLSCCAIIFLRIFLQKFH